jgi:lysozyme
VVTDTLLNLVKSFEGCRLEAYKDIVGVFTIGYGCTGADIVEGLVWTQEQADSDLQNKLQILQQQILELLEVQLSQNQQDALTDFAYNLGIGALKSSFILKCINCNNFDAAPGQFLKWNHAGGVVVPGLTRRRQAEADLFSLA